MRRLEGFSPLGREGCHPLHAISLVSKAITSSATAFHCSALVLGSQMLWQPGKVPGDAGPFKLLLKIWLSLCD